MANPIYMTMSIHTEGGVPKTPTVKFHETREDAEYQYCLFRASASKSQWATHTAMLMTIEGFVIESKTYSHEEPVEEETTEETTEEVAE